MEDTIVAISTALAPAALAVVRLSGPNAVGVADRFVQLNGCRLPELPANQLIHGRVSDNGEFIDDVMICVMRAPRSYTGEDVVEISCHGSTLVARKIVELSFKHGARLAEPGEFTKRAFLNGKMDLTQAESVMDLISAKTQRARAAASRALEGGLSHKLEPVRTALVEALAYVEAHIDFPEEDIGKEEIAFVIERLKHARTEIQKLLATAREGRILREGLRVAIIGRPNVGKSSLLNALTGTERAIVTPIPGTTRDILEESVSIRGIPIVLVDTAGVRKARGQVEQLGIERTRSAIASSDLILHVVDGSKPANKADLELRQSYLDLPASIILVVNKSDLPARLQVPPEFSGISRVNVSCVTGEGLEELREKIESQAGIQRDSHLQSEVFINQRHEFLLNEAIVAVTDAINHASNNGCDELLAQHLRRASDAIGQIVGKVTTDDILDHIFSRFCIGK